MKEVKVGIIGFGTVGAGVAENILKNSEVVAKRTGVKLVLTRIADLDITTDRGVAVPRELLTTDAAVARPLRKNSFSRRSAPASMS